MLPLSRGTQKTQLRMRKAVCMHGFLLLSLENCAFLPVLPQTSGRVGLVALPPALSGMGTQRFMIPSCSAAWAGVNAFDGEHHSPCAETGLGFLWDENTVQNTAIRNALRGAKHLLHYQKIHAV